METIKARCRCGTVAFDLVGKPMMQATCYCDSCQTAGRALAELPGAPTIVGPDGGSAMILFRKDRIDHAIGIDHLHEHRLGTDSPTRRMVASCCNTPLALDFTKGFWLSVYLIATDRAADASPPPKLRAHTGAFMRKLTLSWAAMGFRRPKLPW